MNKNIKYLFVISTFVLFLLWLVNWEYQDFIKKIEETWYSSESILQKQYISRYELSKFLNFIDCNDCSIPRPEIRNSLTADWLVQFKARPDKNFEDLIYDNTIFDWENQYWCVAYAWYMDWMNWYPAQTSPWCPGRFCWANNTTYSEFVQSIFNMVSQNVYSDFTINWWNVKSWRDWLSQNSLEFNYLNINDLQNINNEFNRCWNWSCNALNYSTFNTYIKYCTFNISSCWFSEFSNISEWSWPVAELNVLQRYNVFTRAEASNLNLDAYINWQELLRISSRVAKITNCSFNLDYSWDWLLNHIDNCPYHYNPNQSDMDWDWVWDVCDNDIDWDWIPNPIWIVDDRWNINPALLEISEDKCPLNYDTTNSSTCISGDWNAWLLIWADKTFWNAPLVVKFNTIVVWNLTDITWDFWNWQYATWREPTAVFINPWKYNVIARWIDENWNYVTSNLTITVWESYSDKTSFQAICNPLSWYSPLSLSCKTEYSWNIDKVIWIVDWQIYELWPDDELNLDLIWAWDKQIVSKAYDSNGNLIWESTLNISILDSNQSWQTEYWSNLIIDNLYPSQWDIIWFQTIVNWFDISDISSITWNFWDWEVYTYNELETAYSYNQPGSYTVVQTIILNDWTVLINTITINVSQSWDTMPWVALNINPLQSFVWQDINMNWLLNNISNSEITSIRWSYWNWVVNNFYWNWQDNLNRIYFYNNPWNYNVNLYVYTLNDWVLTASATIVVQWQNICAWDLSQFQCDMNGNGIPDICDTDISWDWFPNLVWLILFEQFDDEWNCIYNENNIDISRLNEQISLWDNWYDNCPFHYNPDQIDSNWSWFWDICDYLSSIVDIDIDDTSNLLIPNFNDFDFTPSISSTNCMACPCHFANFDSAIVPWDLIRAVLFDAEWNIFYRYSQPFRVRQILWN